METPARRALLSVSDKLGLADFARGLVAAGVEIYSTGGTRRHLESEGIAVIDVAQYTGFPEMMDGRLKTLHPKIFGGLLCRRDRRDDMESITAHGIVPFDLVAVNLYPFEATVAREDVSFGEAVEQIDIGGPSLVRAAAKNHAFVAIVTSPQQYSEVLESIAQTGATSSELRLRLAAAAFSHTAAYDRAIATYFQTQTRGADEPAPATVGLLLERKAVLRYGENPHQQAALYRIAGERGANLVAARQLNGKELSYNNLLDLDAALAIARSLASPAVAVIKHNNPCGAAVATTLAEATENALAGDPVSAFGSVLGMNRTMDVATAEVLARPGLFVEAIVAPDYEAAAVGILTTRPKWKNNVRLMQVGQLDDPPSARHWRYIDGGLLWQRSDVDEDSRSQWKCVSDVAPGDAAWEDLAFGWSLVRFVKSNAIVLARGGAVVGVGAGQMSRVDSVEIAIRKAGDRAEGAALASDAFFPFPDSIDRAAEAGVSAIIQPGGSKQDDQVIAACNRHKIPLVFTGRRHFRH